MSDEGRLARYRQLRESLPELFVNPPDAPYEILHDATEVSATEAEVARRLTEQGHPAMWAHIGVVFEDPYGVTLRDAVRTPTGVRGTYVRRINPGNAPGVVMLPMCSGKVVLVRHFRHSTRQWHLEIPRGFGTPGSRPEEDARRELIEEIGVDPENLTSLGIVYPDTGQTATKIFLFLAEIADFHAAGHDEGIESAHAVTPGRLAELIRTGEITDGFTINAYARADLLGLLR